MSSPIAYPPSSSPAVTRQPRYNGSPKAKRPRATAGFLDDDSDNDNDAPGKKRQHMQDVRKTQTTMQAPSPPSSTPSVSGSQQDAPEAQMQDAGVESQDLRFSQLIESLQSRNQSIATPSSAGQTGNSKWFSTCSGKQVFVKQREPTQNASYESMVAARSRTKEGRAKRAYYGIDVQELVAEAEAEAAIREKERNEAIPSIESDTRHTKSRNKLWTEQYRAKTFSDLVGDDYTNRQVLRWLKKWDRLVYPGAARAKSVKRPGQATKQEDDDKAVQHRKMLMLTGPPGLGKTTLAHVCAKHAGYEVLEINASDDRSKGVVDGRIRTSLGTESVKTVEHGKTGTKSKVAKPVCVVVDEVDGAVTGSGGSGEGGFVSALINLVTIDQKNSSEVQQSSAMSNRRRKKGDDFRQMRPLILICNDVYAPSLRPLRQSGLAEVVHVGKPSVDAVVHRLTSVFEKEGVTCEKDAARRLCEAAWGMSSGIDGKKGAQSPAEGDLRGVMVVGEWVAARFKASLRDAQPAKLTRQWIDKHILHELAHGGGGARGIGRGNTKDIVTRVFQEHAGFPKQADVAADTKTCHEQPKTQLSFGEQQKKHAMTRLAELVNTSGESDRIITDIFTEYPGREFNDDSYLSKPNAAYEWLNFHDSCSSRVFGGQEWEMAPYLAQPILACHHLFASPHRHVPAASEYRKPWQVVEEGEEEAPLPFTGPRADFAAREAEKNNRIQLQGLQSQLPATLMRSFRSAEDMAVEFVPYLVRLVAPDVKPVVVGGSSDKGAVASVRRESEKIMVRRAAAVLAEVGIPLLKGRIEDVNAGVNARPQWVYRMEPDLDELSTFETAGAHVIATQVPVRFAVRQVLDQELQKTIAARENAARQARLQAGYSSEAPPEVAEDARADASKTVAAAPPTLIKRDFFGRVIQPLGEISGNSAGRGKSHKREKSRAEGKDGGNVWVTFNEGLNNAVRKPVSLQEFLKAF